MQAVLAVDLPDMSKAYAVDITVSRGWQSFANSDLRVARLTYGFHRDYPDRTGGQPIFVVDAEVGTEELGNIVWWFDKFVDVIRAQYPPGYQVEYHTKIPRGDKGFYTTTLRKPGTAAG